MLLKNKRLFFFLIIIFLVIFTSVAHAQEVCDMGNIKKVLRKVLYFYFINPQDSPLSLGELKDLLVFYLGIKEQVGQVDCSVKGLISNSSISSIIDAGGNVTDKIPTCTDGTKYGECSTFKPKYCYTGSLLHRCDYCGCPSPSQCSTSGKCENATCSSDLDCGESGFVRFNNCFDGKLYRNYDNITCLNSQCSNKTVTVLIDDCKSKGEGCEWNQTVINYVCQGKIMNETCVDYDFGDNLLTASYAKKGTQMQYDKCGTAGQNYEIIEGVCQNNEVRGIPHSCPTGTECKNIRFEPAVSAYVAACVNATKGNITSPNSMHSDRIYNMSIMNYNYPIANAYLYIVKGMEKNYAYGSRQSQLNLFNGALYISNWPYDFSSNYSRDWYYNKYGIGSEPNHLSIIISDLPVSQSMNKTLDVMITIDNGVKKIVYFPAIPVCPGSNHWRVFYISEDGSTYYATKNHQCGYADLSPEEAIVSQHLARSKSQDSNLSAIEWPTNIKSTFVYGADPSMWGKIGQMVSFDYKNISTLKSLRLYEKKPSDNGFNLVSEFTNLASVGCNKNVLSGNWKLSGDCSLGYAGKTWHAQRINPPYLNIDLQPASFYNVGEYKYYITAVDASNNYKSSAIGSMHFLNPLTILSPTSSQSPISKLNFTWTSTSGWPIGATPYNIQIAEVNSSILWSKSGIASSPVIYDGSALDPSKKYIAHVYGFWHNTNQSQSYTAIDASTTTFWISNAINQTLSEAFEIVQITTSTASQANSDIYSNTIVWDENSRIYMYDIVTKQATRITSSTSQKPSIYGSKIVWQDFRNGNGDIYMYDISTGQETRITTNTADQWEPEIYGNKIVYRTSGTIYMYDLLTKQETQITANTASQAKIYGDKVVWEDRRHGLDNGDIYMYDLSTKQETRITTNTAHQLYPDIYGNKIVWEDKRNGNFDIYMYDISTGKETQITTNLANQWLPQIYGNKIVWDDYRSDDYGNGNSDIYMYDLSTNQEVPITINTAIQNWPAIYDNKVVWEDNRNGNWDIYMATIK